jgi:hypothetical protein
MMRMLLILTAVSLTVASGAAHAMGVGAASGFSWNQAAADASARAWAAEGWCFPGGCAKCHACPSRWLGATIGLTSRISSAFDQLPQSGLTSAHSNRWFLGLSMCRSTAAAAS